MLLGAPATGRRDRDTAPDRRRRSLALSEMFLLALIVVPLVELLVFIEVAQAIGWLLALVLLLGTSLLGVQLMRIQGRSAIQRVSLAVSQRRPPADAAIDGALGFLGAVLLAVPGFVTDALGALLLLRPTRSFIRRRALRRYSARLLSFLARTGRFASQRRGAPHVDVDSTAIDDDIDQLGGGRSQ